MVMQGTPVGSGVVVGQWQNHGPEDINAGIDRDHYIYSPRNYKEQMQIAAHFFPAELGTPQAYARKTAAYHQLMEQVRHERGLAGRARLQEAISVNDFNFIMGDTIYRELIKTYGVPDSPMEFISQLKKVDTPERPAKLFQVMGLRRPLHHMNPGEVPPARYPQDTGMAITVEKYGADVYFLAETMWEDDLGGLRDTPSALGDAVKGTEGINMTMMYADSGGFRDAQGGPFFTTNNDRVLNPSLDATNPAGISNMLLANNSMNTRVNARLSLPAIQAARTQMSKFLSPVDNYPINTKVVHLVVGVGLAEQAQNILNAQSYTTEQLSFGGHPEDTTTTPPTGMFRQTGSMKSISGIQLHVDPYLHVVANTGSIADTMWMLVAEKNASFAAFYHSKLKGYEMPVIQRQLPRFQPIGATANSFDDRISLGFRVIHLFGQEWGDPRSVIASKGTDAA